MLINLSFYLGEDYLNLNDLHERIDLNVKRLDELELVVREIVDEYMIWYKQNNLDVAKYKNFGEKVSFATNTPYVKRNAISGKLEIMWVYWLYFPKEKKYVPRALSKSRTGKYTLKKVTKGMPDWQIKTATRVFNALSIIENQSDFYHQNSKVLKRLLHKQRQLLTNYEDGQGE